MSFVRNYIIVLVVGLAQIGCTTLVVGGAAGAGGYTAGQEQHNTGNTGNTGNDAMITSTINKKYVNDKLINAADIHVSTHQGVVTLNGTVTSQATASWAVTLARSTKYVTRVVSRIGVKP